MGGGVGGVGTRRVLRVCDCAPTRLTPPQRADAGFVDNNYWRGRIWGPQVQLLYWALRRYDHVPEARAARLSLVEQGARLGLTLWRGSAQVRAAGGCTLREHTRGCVECGPAV